MNYKPLIFILCTALLYNTQSLAQVVGIHNGDGTPLTTTWCYEDTMHALQGLPAGGTFSGCGIEERNGVFYFNPKMAAEDATRFIYTCPITYTPPASSGYSRVSKTMRINAPVVVDAGGDRVICGHGDFELPVPGVYGASYEYSWSPGTYFIDSTQNPAKGHIDIHGSQTFYLTVRDVNSGCMAYDTVTLFDKSVFAEILEQDIPDTICPGSTITLNARPYDNYAYRWFSGEGEETHGLGFNHTYDSSGNYLLMLVVQDSLCPDTLKHTLNVVDFRLKLSSNHQQVERMQEITLTSSASFNPYQITSWRPSALFPNQTAHSQTIAADSTRFYTIVGETPLGCVDSASTFVAVIPRMFVPNAFSPNGDGLNDVFRVVSDGDVINILDFEVYDRWGNRIWAGRGSSDVIGWDGTRNGVPADAGTYFYILKSVTRQGEPFNRQGDVTLIR